MNIFVGDRNSIVNYYFLFDLRFVSNKYYYYNHAHRIFFIFKIILSRIMSFSQIKFV